MLMPSTWRVPRRKIKSFLWVGYIVHGQTHQRGRGLGPWEVSATVKVLDEAISQSASSLSDVEKATMEAPESVDNSSGHTSVTRNLSSPKMATRRYWTHPMRCLEKGSGDLWQHYNPGLCPIDSPINGNELPILYDSPERATISGGGEGGSPAARTHTHTHNGAEPDRRPGTAERGTGSLPTPPPSPITPLLPTRTPRGARDYLGNGRRTPLRRNLKEGCGRYGEGAEIYQDVAWIGKYVSRGKMLTDLLSVSSICPNCWIWRSLEKDTFADYRKMLRPQCEFKSYARDNYVGRWERPAGILSLDQSRLMGDLTEILIDSPK
ncbi:uncharacterized protein [Narcine bancroftii]|uniref:uncharacterized protein n=1 Tax=Narcine bancroftii TaxID=1343680 RepID=UPI0038311909